MPARLLVLDFDGTMTDAEAEGIPFRDGYLEDVAVLVGRPAEEIRQLAVGFEKTIAQDAQAHGWLYDGRIVAPASVDPYLRMMPVARYIFDHFGHFTSETERTRLLDGILYKYNYGKTRTAFRPGALAALTALAGTQTWVVTNSHTDAVQAKIRALGTLADGSCSLEWLAERVIGQAKKYALDETFDRVPATLELPGLSRPVLLRRRLYFEALDRLRREAGAEWSEVTVVGDIFELDLCLPLALGARVGLVVNPFTPAYELDFLRARAPQARLIGSLEELPALMGRTLGTDERRTG